MCSVDSEQKATQFGCYDNGLDIMPSVKHAELKRASFSQIKPSKEEKLEGYRAYSYKEYLTRRSRKPQKLPNTVLFDRRAVTRFWTEALHIKSVIPFKSG